MQLTVKVVEWNSVGPVTQDLSILTGNLAIGASTNGAPATSLTATVPDDTAITISATKAGYHPYSIVIDNVYDVNRTIVILLAPNITNINDANYQRPHPMLFTFQDPCSFDVDVYNASSFPGEISWYVNNEVQEALAGATKFTYQGVGVGNFQFKMASRTYYVDPVTNVYSVAWLRQWAAPTNAAYLFPGQAVGENETGNTTIGINVTILDLVAYLEDELQTNTTETEYRPTVDLDFSLPANELDDVSSYNQFETVTVDPYVILNKVGADPAQYTIDWVITDPEGLPVSLPQSEFPLVLSQAALRISFRTDKLGTYIIKATINDLHCGKSYTTTRTIKTKMFVYAETTGDCSSFNLFNKSSLYDITYSIQLIGGTAPQYTGTLISDHISNLGSKFTFTLTDIGIHKIQIQWIDENEVQHTIFLIVNNFCVLLDCLAGYINETLCHPENLCDPCPDSLRLNQMVLFNMAFSMKLNKEFSFNNFYSTLDQSKLDEFMSLNKLMDKVKDFCSRIGCGGIDTTFTDGAKQFSFGLNQQKKGGCGCGGSKPGGCGCGGASHSHSSSNSPCKGCS